MALRVPKAKLSTELSESMIKQFGVVPEPIEVKKWVNQASWSKAIRRMADLLPKDAKPQAVAGFRVRRRVAN